LSVKENKTLAQGSTDSYPSDKNKNLRWMGHSSIPRGSAKPVDDQYGQGSGFVDL